MASLGAVGAFSRQADSALNVATVRSVSPVGITSGTSRGNIGQTTGDSHFVQGGVLYVGQAVSSAAVR